MRWKIAEVEEVRPPGEDTGRASGGSGAEGDGEDGGGRGEEVPLDDSAGVGAAVLVAGMEWAHAVALDGTGCEAEQTGEVGVAVAGPRLPEVEEGGGREAAPERNEAAAPRGGMDPEEEVGKWEGPEKIEEEKGVDQWGGPERAEREGAGPEVIGRSRGPGKTVAD